MPYYTPTPSPAKVQPDWLRRALVLEIWLRLLQMLSAKVSAICAGLSRTRVEPESLWNAARIAALVSFFRGPGVRRWPGARGTGQAEASRAGAKMRVALLG
jgi:hypothetical protein